MRTLVLGGIRSGKSQWAEDWIGRQAGPSGSVRYVATGSVSDDADFAAEARAEIARLEAELPQLEAALARRRAASSGRRPSGPPVYLREKRKPRLP